MQDLFIILPTYNEADNLATIVPNIVIHTPAGSKILIVDDNSEDGTGKVADKLAKVFPNTVKVLHRPRKEGLGRAYIAGFQKALEDGAQFIIQMDSDLSHPPELIPMILEKLKNFELVLGSRYISGGGIKNWGLHRRALSWGGNLYARTILRSPIHDLTGGFKGYHRKVVESLLKSALDSSGYCFQIETTYRAMKQGYTYCEIPFIFTERKHGLSKMNKGIIWEALTKVWNLKKFQN